MKPDSSLNASSRRNSLRSMKSEEFDLLIIGGGITGTGAALDAAARGLKVALVEQCDLASGTSSKSSKMIHGGLRYLEQLNVSLVREALGERSRLLNVIAPHLVKPVSFLYPLRYRLWERAYVGLGVWLYDRLGGARHLPKAKHLSHSATAAIAPALKPGSYTGGIQFWDAQEDDARYVMFVARTAVSKGAALATRVKCNKLLVAGEKVVGAQVTDLETGECFNLKARHVATATGAWTGLLQNDVVEMPFTVRLSKGVHILLPAEAIDLGVGLLARTNSGLLFVIPWEGHWLVGDTDTEWLGLPEEITPSSADVAQLLSRLNAVLTAPVTADQIIGVFAGIRPLVSDASHKDMTKLSRNHVVATPLPGLTMIGGGKYTTYRVMAADLIDEVVRCLGDEVYPSSTTEHLPLVGANQFRKLKDDDRALAASSGLTVVQIERLLGRYGDRILELISLITANPEMAEPLSDGDVLKGEIAYACTHEGALHIEDVMERRTRMNILLPDQGQSVLAEVAKIMQEVLGWTDEQTLTEWLRYQENEKRLRQLRKSEVV
ncbi:UNVERIFIED_ORG: glycerol-3-phosphate dehydrogenase [Pseudomonas lini]